MTRLLILEGRKKIGENNSGFEFRKEVEGFLEKVCPGIAQEVLIQFYVKYQD